MGVARHGHAANGRHTPEYEAWRSMRERCRRPAHYPNHAGRGICVCARWTNSFEAFLADVGSRPGPGYSIDRIDPNGHYEPGNVRWATASQQARNKRTVPLLTFHGESMSVADWADRLGMKRNTLTMRLRAGWSTERALTTPVLR